jgi:hypothetical protein
MSNTVNMNARSNENLDLSGRRFLHCLQCGSLGLQIAVAPQSRPCVNALRFVQQGHHGRGRLARPSCRSCRARAIVLDLRLSETQVCGRRAQSTLDVVLSSAVRSLSRSCRGVRGRAIFRIALGHYRHKPMHTPVWCPLIRSCAMGSRTSPPMALVTMLVQGSCQSRDRNCVVPHGCHCAVLVLLTSKMLR